MYLIIVVRLARRANLREFRDVVFNSSVAPYYVTSKYRIRLKLPLSNTASSNTTSLNSRFGGR